MNGVFVLLDRAQLSSMYTGCVSSSEVNSTEDGVSSSEEISSEERRQQSINSLGALPLTNRYSAATNVSITEYTPLESPTSKGVQPNIILTKSEKGEQN